MNLESIMCEIEDSFAAGFEASISREKFHEKIQYWQKLANEQKLVRERFALTTFISYQAAKYNRKLSLVYVFQDKHFSTSVKPIPGTGTTEELHEYAFPSAVWNAMGKDIMYPNGKVYSSDQVEDRSVTNRVQFIPVQGGKLSHLQK